MKKLTEESANVVIFVPQIVTFDKFATAIALAYYIIEKGKNATIATSKQIPQKFQKAFDISGIKIKEKLEKKEVVLSINRKAGEVGDVRWREVDDKIQFIITPEDGKFEFNDVDLHSTGDDFDLMIVIGCKDLEQIGPVYTSNSKLFDDTKIINIDINPQNTQFGTENYVGSVSSLSEWIINLFREEKMTYSEKVVSILIKGIMWVYEGFRSDGKFTEILRSIQSIDKNMNVLRPITDMFQSLNIDEARYIGKMIENIKMEDNFVYSSIPYSDIQGLRLDQILYPEVNILSRLNSFHVALIFSEFKVQKIRVEVYSVLERYNLEEIFKQFSPRGGKHYVQFKVHGGIDDVRERVLNLVRGKGTYEKVAPKQELEREEKKSHVPLRKEKNKKEKNKKKEKNDQPLRKASTLPEPLEPPSTPFIMPKRTSTPPPRPQPYQNPLPKAQS